MKHTDLPWVHDRKINVYSDDATGSIIATAGGFHWAPSPESEQEANAAFIVKACNNHYQLLATIKSIKSNLTTEDIDINLIAQLIFMTDRAIKQAEAE